MSQLKSELVNRGREFVSAKPAIGLSEGIEIAVIQLCVLWLQG